MTRAAAPLGAAALAITVAAAGCGSASLSDIQLRSRAGAICARADRELARMHSPRGAAGGRAFLTRGLAVLEPELRQLQSLKAPKDVSDVYTTGVSALSGQVAGLRRAVRAIGHGADPVIAFSGLQHDLAPLERQGNDAWDALQVPACLSR